MVEPIQPLIAGELGLVALKVDALGAGLAWLIFHQYVGEFT
jgi:hypothetical protein